MMGRVKMTPKKGIWGAILAEKKWNGDVERYPPLRSTFLAGTIFGTVLERHPCKTLKTRKKTWNGTLERT